MKLLMLLSLVMLSGCMGGYINKMMDENQACLQQGRVGKPVMTTGLFTKIDHIECVEKVAINR